MFGIDSEYKVLNLEIIGRVRWWVGQRFHEAIQSLKEDAMNRFRHEVWAHGLVGRAHRHVDSMRG